MSETDKRYLAQLGARILSEANDLKRTPEALARELGYAPDVIRNVIAGTADAGTARDVLTSMASTYPISLSDVWIEPDHTDAGVAVMTEEQSRRSARVFDREDKDGDLAPYYEYRDTAMSAGAPYKPEWIRPLRVVADSDPDNPNVAYNNGHLMHQFTFFIGAVNFYWRSGGETHCAEMNTGDSNYITPFVPHSFASRDPDRLGLIIAVTYAAGVRRALNELASMDADAVNRITGDLRDPVTAFAARLGTLLDAESLSAGELAGRLAAAGMDAARARTLAGAEALPGDHEWAPLAEALGVRLSDMVVQPLDGEREVVIEHMAGKQHRPYPATNRCAYRLTEMARTPHQPLLRAFEVAVLGGADGPAPVRHGLHEYIYNYGDQPIGLHWDGGRTARLGPGDSAYIRPFVGHGFSVDGDEGRMVLVRVPGALTVEVMNELAGYDTGGRARVAQETMRWF